MNGDGYDDVIVSALFYDNGETEEGRAYGYYGVGDNENCATAYSLSVPTQVMGNTSLAAHHYVPWCASGSTAKDLVYAFSGLAGYVYTVDLLGDSAFNTVLFVRSGDCATGTQIGCNDDFGGELNHSQLVFTASDTGTYYVFVDGYSDAFAGRFTLTITSSTTTTTTTTSSTTTTTIPSGDDDSGDDDSGDDDSDDDSDDDATDDDSDDSSAGDDDDDDGGCCGC